MKGLDNWMPGKLLELGDGRMHGAEYLLDYVWNPHDRAAAEGWLQHAEDFRPEDGQSLLARLRHARKYAKEADKALQNIESIVQTRHQLPNGNARQS
ncbi:hypothetical protein EI94DRAFT_1795707 [Lactarius quietus]|nr:hypothetical protein EI94DRAFT_1795707 [Lactarius quietus]